MMNRQTSNVSLFGWIVFQACFLLIFVAPARLPAADSTDSTVAPGGTVSTNRAPGTVSVFARVQAIDAAKNSFSASNASSVFLVRCSPTTLSKVGGPVVKASDLNVGAEVVIRGRVQADGSISATMLASRIPTPAPGMKPATPKDSKGPSSK